MRELAVRIKFTTPCLGNVRKHHRVQGRVRNHFLLPRNPGGKVIFMNTWWQAILAQAAKILCRHHGEVKSIRFAMEVDGKPRPLEEGEVEDPRTGRKQVVLKGHYHRYYAEDRFSKHEAFFPGTVIGLTCIVPQGINDEDFHRLMELAGKYCGISPGLPGEFGFFTVESIRSTGTGRAPRRKREVDEAPIEKPSTA